MIRKYNDHKILTYLLFIFALMLISLWLFRDTKEIFNGGDELYDYIVNISLGYVVSYIFYYINIYMPNKILVIDACLLIGDCMAYLYFNTVQISDILNRPHSELSVIVLSSKSNHSFQEGCDMEPLNAMCQNIIRTNSRELIERIHQEAKEYLPNLENKIGVMINHQFELYPHFYGEINTMLDRGLLEQIDTEKLKNIKKEDIWELNLIINRYEKKKKLLLDNEKNLSSYDMSITRGEREILLRERF